MEAGDLDDSVRGSVYPEDEEVMGLLGRHPAQVVARMADRISTVREERNASYAECARLKAEVERLRQSGQSIAEKKFVKGLAADVEAIVLRAQLREARELLDRALGLIEAHAPTDPLREEIEAFQLEPIVDAIKAHTSKGEAQETAYVHVTMPRLSPQAPEGGDRD